MSGFLHVVKTILLPLLFALALYLLLAHLLLPFIRRHRTRYSQYLPVSLSPNSSTTAPGFRNRITSALSNLFFVPTSFIVPASFRQSRRVVDANVDDSEDEDIFDDEEGEGMVGFDPISERRREALEQRRSLGWDVGADDGRSDRRLSRELEEGFRDESDSDTEGGNGDERRHSLSRSRTGTFY